MVLENTLESPLDRKVINSVNPKGNQPCTYIGRTDTEAPILWPPDAKSQFMEKFQMLGEIEGKRIRGLQRFAGIFDMSLRKLWEIVNDIEAQSVAFHGVTKSWK